MARFSIEDGGLASRIAALGDGATAAAIAVVSAGAGVMATAWRDAIQSHGLVLTGAMLGATRASAPKADADGVSSEVYPRGNDSKGTSNALKAFVLNYGTSRIPPSHWVDTANTAGKPAALAAMQTAWHQFLADGAAAGGE